MNNLTIIPLFVLIFFLVNWKIISIDLLILFLVNHLLSSDKIEVKISWQKNILLFFLILIPSLVIYRVFDWNLGNGEIASNVVLCKEKVYLSHCNKPDRVIARGFYKVMPERQEVLWWVESDKTPEKWTDCAIKDQNNWSCKVADGYRELGFTDGKYWTRATSLETDPQAKDMYEKMYSVSKLEYLLLSVKKAENPTSQLIMDIAFGIN